MSNLDLLYFCPLCSNKDIQHLIKSTWSQSDRNLLAMLEIDYETASWSHCHECNHVFLNPSFSEHIEDRLYGAESIYRKYSFAGKNEEEYLKEIDATINNKSMLHASHFRRLKRIKQFLNTRKLVCVDFGAGFGAAESAVESFGWDYYGYEKDAWCLSKANEIGRSVKPDLPETIRNKGADLVYSSQVFEHIKTPNEAVEIIRTILKPGGHIFIDVPTHVYALNVMSSIGPGGLNCMNWGHYHSYTPESLTRLLTNWGFKIVKIWLESGDVNILAKKLDPFDPPLISELPIYSTTRERLKIQLLRWIFNPTKFFLVQIPVNILRGIAPNFLKEYVRIARIRNK